MRTWGRATVNVICGCCRQFIDAGDPVLLVRVPEVGRTLKRCERCAGPAPADLPSLTEFKRIQVVQPVWLTGVTPMLPLGREPGEEG